jgi:hypothetical protein
MYCLFSGLFFPPVWTIVIVFYMYLVYYPIAWMNWTELKQTLYILHYALFNWLIIYDFTSRSRTFISWLQTSPLAGEGRQNLGFYSALRAFEQGGIFIVPHLLRHGTSVFPVSFEGPPLSVAFHDNAQFKIGGKDIIQLFPLKSNNSWYMYMSFHNTITRFQNSSFFLPNLCRNFTDHSIHWIMYKHIWRVTTRNPESAFQESC